MITKGSHSVILSTGINVAVLQLSLQYGIYYEKNW